MTKQEELITKFEEIMKEYRGDEEAIHSKMSDAMLEYIDSARITELFNAYADW